MKVNKILPDNNSFPNKLKHVQPEPRCLFVIGNIDALNSKPVVSIVGSRAVTPYGRQVTERFARDLASRGVVIVSGLALGIDAIAHMAALEASGTTVAVLPSPVDTVYPATNRQLAQRILDSGGALISEYGDDDRSEAFKMRFIERNRLVSGLADVLLITEASEKSGTMHTANFAIEQGKTVMAVPGNITSPTSTGTNNLIKTGAIAATDISDVLTALGLDTKSRQQELFAANEQELTILTLLQQGVTDSAELLAGSELASPIFNQTLTMLEITGKIKPLGAGHWSIK